MSRSNVFSVVITPMTVGTAIAVSVSVIVVELAHQCPDGSPERHAAMHSAGDHSAIVVAAMLA